MMYTVMEPPLQDQQKVQTDRVTVMQPSLPFHADEPANQNSIIEKEIVSNIIQWQRSNKDLPTRRAMLQRIIAISEHHSVSLASTRSQRAFSHLAKRIELSLYAHAASLEEYMNCNTLRRRLHALVTISYHETAANKCLGRKRAAPGNVATTKRRRLQTFVQHESDGHSAVLERLNEETLRHVFSFLDAQETIRARAINKSASVILPQCVTVLSVKLSNLAASFENGQGHYGAISTLGNLERLIIYRDSDLAKASLSSTKSLRAWSCSELDVSDDNFGEKIVETLSNAINHGACKRIKSLQLISVFTNTMRTNGLKSLCSVLAQGRCPNLEDLLIGGNSIGDIGCLYLARVLDTKNLSNLKTLDLRKNYIGELGVRRLIKVLNEKCAINLKSICLGGNLITDNCLQSFTSAFDNSACPKLRFLGLEDNYLTSDGVQRIIQSAVRGGILTKVYRVEN